MTDNSKFSVLDMANAMAAEANEDISDLFSKDSLMQEPIETESAPIPEKKSVPWTPDKDVLEGLPEMTTGPVVYKKEELVFDESEGLKNVADENAIQVSRETMDELSRTAANIEDAKKRHGIISFQIPEGQFHASITAAAGDTDYKRAQAGLDEIFEEIKRVHPEFIREWSNKDHNKKIENETNEIHEDINKPETHVDVITDSINEEIVNAHEDQSNPDITVVVDKSQLKDISWSNEEVEKIRKARTVNLNIVEAKNLEYYQIEDADENLVDDILMPYQRKSNDIVVALPASKYRAVISGLSYPEVIDLSSSVEMNELDGEKKKWSICFNHIHNPSIGPWEEYQWYIDPKTKMKMKIDYNADIPSGINPNKVYSVSKYDDFLQKTSFLDLEFILWKVLCATAMDKEIISIDCHAVNENGVVCNKSYDWIYSPNELLTVGSIDPAVVADMESVGNASSKEEIEEVYRSSMLQTNNVAKLSSSGFSVVFGHISAYEYLTSIYAELKLLEDSDENDPTIASKGLNLTMLTCIKAFLIPQDNGKYKKVHGVNNLKKVINVMDEIDWQTLSELVRIMTEPYQFKFALRDIVCPKCQNRSVIPIENMAKLLFIVARSLASVTVTLRRT